MEVLIKVRQKCFFGMMLVGGLAGLCETHWDDQGLLFNFFCGLIVVTLGSFMGSFFGFFVKNVIRQLRGIREFVGEYSDGILIGSLFGAIIGIVLQILIGTQAHSALGAGIGSLVGGFLGALPDDTILAYVLTALLEHDEEIKDIVDSCPPETL